MEGLNNFLFIFSDLFVKTMVSYLKTKLSKLESSQSITQIEVCFDLNYDVIKGYF